MKTANKISLIFVSVLWASICFPWKDAGAAAITECYSRIEIKLTKVETLKPPIDAFELLLDFDKGFFQRNGRRYTGAKLTLTPGFVDHTAARVELLFFPDCQDRIPLTELWASEFCELHHVICQGYEIRFEILDSTGRQHCDGIWQPCDWPPKKKWNSSSLRSFATG